MGIMAAHLKKPEPRPSNLPIYQPPPLWEDPRPDLQEDHHLWQKLLQWCKGDEQLLGYLNGMRCQGTLLVKGKSSYVLRPLIHPQLGWTSQEEYEADRDLYLKPYAELLKELLLDLTAWAEKRERDKGSA